MNLEKLQVAQQDFLLAYPDGFSDPKMVEIGKKHKVDKMTEFAQETLAPHCFSNPTKILQDWQKLVSRSSMVSMFEKPKFKDMINDLSADQQQQLSQGLYEFLHGDQQLGFEMQLPVFEHYKLAKWALMTIASAYYHPTTEVFVKPTTAKGVIKFFELPDVIYKAKPSWAFYQAYRQHILTMASYVDNNLNPNTAAFCGFLMMSLPSAK